MDRLMHSYLFLGRTRHRKHSDTMTRATRAFAYTRSIATGASPTHTIWTYSHHCQIADKNPSKRWNGEFWGFRIDCIGFGLGVPPLGPHLYRILLFSGYVSTTVFCVLGFCVLGLSVSFPATTPRATTPVQIHSS